MTGEPETGAGACDPVPQVFFFPGIRGDVSALARFRDCFLGRIRFETVSYPSWQAMVRAGGGFETLVELACKDMLALPPQRPLRLAGYSFGGVVALALARRLAAEGRRVAWLAILDTDLEHYLGSPNRAAWASPTLGATLGATLGEGVRHIRQDGLVRAASHAVARLAGSLGIRAVLRRLSTRRRLAPFPFGLPPLCRLPGRADAQVQWTQRVDIMAAWLRACPRASLDIPIMLFRTADHPASASPDLGWSGVSPRVAVHQVEGDHWTMFTRRHEPALTALFGSVCLNASGVLGLG